MNTLSRIALTPEAPCIWDLTKSEVIEIVQIIRKCYIRGEDDKAKYYTELLHKGLSLPDTIDYIMSEDNLEQIADKMIKASSNGVITL